MWTIEKVRETLPDVTVETQGRSVRCCVGGRNNRFATVYDLDTLTHWEFPWVTIVNCLNANRPLKV